MATQIAFDIKMRKQICAFDDSETRREMMSIKYDTSEDAVLIEHDGYEFWITEGNLEVMYQMISEYLYGGVLKP